MGGAAGIHISESGLQCTPVGATKAHITILGLTPLPWHWDIMDKDKYVNGQGQVCQALRLSGLCLQVTT